MTQPFTPNRPGGAASLLPNVSSAVPPGLSAPADEGGFAEQAQTAAASGAAAAAAEPAVAAEPGVPTALRQLADAAVQAASPESNTLSAEPPRGVSGKSSSKAFNSASRPTAVPSGRSAAGIDDGGAGGSNTSRQDDIRCSEKSISSADQSSTARSSTGYGIPCGQESMKSLRRHVELLIDREMNTKSRSRLETCLDALEPERLDPQLLRLVCAKGLPEGCPALRSLYWRILLNCLPLHISEWQLHRRKLRSAYECYKSEFIREPEAVRRLRRMQQQQQQREEDVAASFTQRNTESPTSSAPPSSQSSDEYGKTRVSPAAPFSIPLASVSDHPLSRNETSEWRGYWADAEVFDQINKDVFRTRPELCFFALNPQQTVARQQQLHLYPPPHTRQPQPSVPPTDEVPLLVNYDDLLRKQGQRKDTLEPGGNSTPTSSKSTSSSTQNSSGVNNEPADSSARSSTSLSRRAFRLPAAFRPKKAGSASAASSWEEDVISGTGAAARGTSSSGSSSSKRHAASFGGSGSFSGLRCGTSGKIWQGEGGDTECRLRTESSSLTDKPVSQLIDQFHRRGVSDGSRKPADAADALEATAEAAKAARQFRRKALSARSQEENKTSRMSAPDISLPSGDAGASEVADKRGQPADRSLPDLMSREPAGRQLSQSSLAASAAASLRLNSNSSSVFTEHAENEDRTRASPSWGGEKPTASGEAAGRAEAASGEEKAAKAEQQPWRAPAGVQDVCNMLKPKRHYDVLSRLLFIYAKVNPGICYVQGMNEILAPIYYTLMTDPTYTDYEQAEAEVFYCFSEVMQQQRDAFCKALDPTDAGVRGRLARLDRLLRHKDEEIWMHLNAMGVEPQFYALRWLLLMLTQEFEMPDVLALWDGFIADSGRPLPLLYYVCVSIIIWLKPALLAGDFSACMKLLQHLPSFDPKALISSAMRQRADDLLGTRSSLWRPSLPFALGESRGGDGLDELDPLQVLESQLKTPSRPAIVRTSTAGGLAATTTLASLQTRVAAWAKEKAAPAGDSAEASSPANKADDGLRGNLEPTDPALEHLKRLAEVGVEQAFRGATKVSQYLNNSGLSVGLASNITSFFSSEPLPRSSGSVVEEASAGATERSFPSVAAKMREAFSSSQPAASFGGSAMGYETSKAAKAPSQASGSGEGPALAGGLTHDDCRASSGERARDAGTLFLPTTDGLARIDSSCLESPEATPAVPSPGRPHAVLDELWNPPSGAETPPLSSPTVGGLQITIL
ncbi:hypothetical protein Efla_000631 [Eimeria flavescens]